MAGAYYNEFDPKAAAWLRALIAEGLIAPGEVDSRSIAEVQPNDLEGYTQCHFFAGIGGWSLALRRAMWPDARPVWTGSCPCQPFSLAGKQAGFDDSRHLWPEFRRLISERRPATVFGEQVASASDWLRLVRGDLEALDYAVGAMPIEAASAGADHLRDRFWFVGDYQGDRRGERRPEHEVRRGRSTAAGDGGMVYAESERRDGRQDASGPPVRPGLEAASGVGLADTDRNASDPGRGNPGEVRGLSEAERQPEHGAALSGGSGEQYGWAIGADGKARRVKPGVRLLVNGFPSRVGLLRGFGNAIDPRPAAAFIKAADEAMSTI